MKFKILSKVKSFSDAHGHEYFPGDVVDLPPSYLGETWLEPLEKLEDKKPEYKAEFTLPLEAPKTQKKVKKKSKSS